ncbi:MAG: cysteine synthase [Planctomycetota bacterium]|nr:MAG: cysteine synthase [Planctomycetota bacterium]
MTTHPPDTMDPVLRDALALVTRLLTPGVGPEVAKYEPFEALARRIDLSLPEEGLPSGEVSRLLEDVVGATPVTASPRFLNQLFGGRDPAAVAGELLAAVLNTSMYTYKAAGANALIERELTGTMARLVGFDHGEGVFAPGGSMSNFCAIVMARNAAAPSARQRGLTGEALTLYTSEQSHYSITKGAAMAGIGRERVRRVPCDRRGRMAPEALERMIAEDKAAGLTPFMINATAGTTVLGAYDPIPAIARLAERFGVWLHVDAALGGSVAVSEAHRHLIEGVERADSVTWDAHKMLTVPLTCSVILTRRRGELERNFDEDADYLFQADSAEVNFGGRSIQCGRRNDALKLWALWKRHGTRGLGRRVDRLFGLARLAAELVRENPELELVREPESVTVCFACRGAPAEAVCEHLRRTGRLLVGYGEVDGRNIVRVPFMDPDLTDEDVRAAVGLVCDAAGEIREARPAVGAAK